MVLIEMETAIVMSFLSLLGVVVVIELNNRNWFKRENFKMQKSNVMAENKLKIKKLEKELGVTGVKIPEPEKSFADQIKDLDFDKIKQGLALAQKPEEAYDDDYLDVDEKPDIMESILTYAQENPDAVKNLMAKVGGALEGEKSESGHPRQV